MTSLDGKNLNHNAGRFIDLLWYFDYFRRNITGSFHYLASLGFTEANRSNIPARSNGTMRDYRLEIISSTLAGASVWTFEVNGVPQITINVPALGTGVFTDETIVSFNKDDLLVFNMTEAAAPALITIHQTAK